MAQELFHWTLGELAEKVGARLHGPADAIIRRPIPAGSNDPEGITFAEGEKYYALVRGSAVGAVLLPENAPDLGVPALYVSAPRRVFGYLLALSEQKLALEKGVHPSASIHPTAKVDPTASIGAGVSIGPDSVIGAHVQLHPNVVVGDRCEVGDGTIIKPNATLVKNVRMGKNCVIHSGAVIGAAGFGFAFDGTKHRPIPQVGGVLMGDLVEVGANSCIDRATAGDTKIGTGVKLDNLVQIGHNVTIGDHTVMASMCGIGGSAKIGSFCVLGGFVGVKDHVTLGDGIILAGRTNVMSNISEPGEYFGTLQLPAKQALRNLAYEKRLPEIFARVKELEAEINRLKSE